MKKIILLSSMLGLVSSTAFAGTVGKAISDNYTWLGSFNIGAAWAKSGETQTFYLAPDIIKTYAADKSTNALVSGEVLFGVQKNISRQWIAQLGIAFAQTGNTELQGQIYDDADPEFNNYDYTYKIWNRRITINGKLLLDNENYWLVPWVGAGIGVGFNYAHHFRNTPLLFEAVANPNFLSHTTTALNYSFSAGVLRAINDHWNLGLGYEYVNWGKANLNRAAGQTLNTGLVTRHLSTQGFNFNITYLC